MASNMDTRVKLPGNFPAKLTKWKVKVGSRVNQLTILCLYKNLKTDKVERLKWNNVGTVKNLLVEEGEDIKPGADLLEIEGCSHPTVMKDMCAECGADLREQLSEPGRRKDKATASVAMVHSVPELIVSQKEALELGKQDETRLLKHRKLVLLVDLDQTLIHTTNDNVPPNLKDVNHFQLLHGPTLLWYHTKFRPRTEQFLEEISKLYEMHICTFGVRMYAHTITGFLDPEGKYFSHRILSRNECFNPTSKTANLKALFPCGDTMVCIIDDREDVWSYAANLIPVKPYSFFDGTADINWPPGKADDEDSPDEKKGTPKKKKRQSRIVKVRKKRKDNQEEPKNENGPKPAEEKSTDPEKRAPEVILAAEESKDAVKVSEDKDEKTNKADDDNAPLEDKSDQAKAETPQEDENKSTESTDDIDKEAKSNKTKDEKESLKSTDVTDKKETEKEEDEYDEMVEWDDDDDYLLYLEDILKRIHTAYYELYDQMCAKGETSNVPDMKSIIPYVKKKVLKGANILFSGVVPVSQPIEKSRVFHVAKSLGASVHTELVTDADDGKELTTHLIAARLGTAKVNAAAKLKNIAIVNPEWLWVCAERWERADERLFALTEGMNMTGWDSPRRAITPEGGAKFKGGRLRKRGSTASLKSKAKDKEGTRGSSDTKDTDAKNGSKPGADDPQPGTSQGSSSMNRRFSETYNPLYAFSDDDIATMDREVEELLESGSEIEDSSDDEELRRIVLGQKRRRSTSSEDSLSGGDFPKGWKPARKKSNVRGDDEEDSSGDDPDVDEDKPVTPDNVRRLFKLDDQSSTSNDGSDYDDSIGSVDEEMAAAVEKEFLSY